MFFFSSNDNAISIFPLGSDAIIRPKSIRDLLEYLDDALRQWREVRERIDRIANQTPQIDTAKRRAGSQIERIEHFRRMIRAVSRNTKTPEVLNKLILIARAALADHQSVWVDASSKFGIRYIGSLENLEINEADRQLEVMERDWSSTHTILIAQYKNEAFLNGLEPAILQVIRVVGADVIYTKNSNLRRKAEIKKLKSKLASLSISVHEADNAVNQLRESTRNDSATRNIETEKAIAQISVLGNDARSISEKNQKLNSAIESQNTRLLVVQQAVETARVDTEKKINDFSRSLNDRLVLNEASTYWRSKSTHHAWHAYLASALFAALVIGLLIFGYRNVGEIWLGLTLLQDLGTDKAINLVSIVVVTIPSLLVVWILRHLSRYLIDHFAQLSDADQRSVMMKTYLALVADEKSGVTPEERVLILNALFRPVVSAGRDDASPAAFLETFIKSGDAKKAAPHGS